MSNRQKRFILPEDEIPKYWYNIQADMVNKPMPPLNPATKEPLKPEVQLLDFLVKIAQSDGNVSGRYCNVAMRVRQITAISTRSVVTA